MTKALVVLSGGQDSTTCLAMALASGMYSEVHAITFNYDQRHSAELQAAANIAKLTGVASHEVITLGPILKGTSPLTDKTQELELYDNPSEMAAIIGDRIEKTFVPMRNAMFLTIAANRAVVLGCDDIYTGVCQDDNANYPDCRSVFIDSQDDTINRALGNDINEKPFIRIRTPLMFVAKAQAIKALLNNVLVIDPELEALGVREMAAYGLLAFTHTAYDGVYPPVGHDHASVLRAQGFEEAGVPDPLVFRAYIEGLMELPQTDNYLGADVGFLNNLRTIIEIYAKRLGIDEPHRDRIVGHAPSVEQTGSSEVGGV